MENKLLDSTATLSDSILDFLEKKTIKALEVWREDLACEYVKGRISAYEDMLNTIQILKEELCQK